MKLTQPEISWHETEPVYSCDFQAADADSSWTRLATAGRTTQVQLWRVALGDEAGAEAAAAMSVLRVTLLSTLARHEKPVNCVRWAPDGRTLASGSDDSLVLLWQRSDAVLSGEFEKSGFQQAEAGGDGPSELWTVSKCLRGHLEDVYDLCWSADSAFLVSGAVDSSSIQWRVKGSERLVLRDHRQFVQGVAWDPRGVLVATCGSDRSVRVYRAGSRHTQHLVAKAVFATGAGGRRRARLFQDDSWKSFFRRLAFSPDGLLLVCPAGQIPSAEDAPGREQHAAHIMATRCFGQGPLASVPTGRRPCVAVRFCPVPFELRAVEDAEPALLRLPYRWVYVLLLEDAVLLCDTQRSKPIGFVSNIHYQALNDAAWSADGRLLCVCSTDGYCSFLSFDHEELGRRYRPKVASSPSASVPAAQQPHLGSVAAADAPLVNSKRPAAGSCVGESPKTPRRVPFFTLTKDDKATPPPVAAESSCGQVASIPEKRRRLEADDSGRHGAASERPNSPQQSPVKKKRRVDLVTLSTPRE